MKATEFSKVVSLLRGVKLTNNYKVNRLQVYCNIHKDKWDVILQCRNEYGNDYDTGTAFLYMSQLPVSLKKDIICCLDGDSSGMVGLNDDGSECYETV